MKLLFAIKHLRDSAGGAERVLCTVCSELAARGHDISLVTFDPPGGRPFYSLDVRVKRLDLGIGNAEQQATVFETLHRMVALRKLVKEDRPDVAIGFMHSIYVPLAISFAGISVPVVGSEHSTPEHFRRRPLQLALLIAAIPFVTKTTVPSDAIRARYLSLVRKSMVSIPNPSTAVQGNARPDAAKPRRVLLTVGRLDPQKDQATLIKAFALIAAAQPDWDLRIVGKGILEPQLRDQIRALGLEERVSLPGVTPDIGSEYRGADVFVLPSRHESFGLATSEAMSHGLPVVGFADCPGTNELVEDGRTGLLAAGGPQRATSLARALKTLMQNPAMRREMGGAGKQAIARSWHSAQSVSDLWEALLVDVSGRTLREE